MGGENFSKLQTNSTGNFLCTKVKVFVSKCSANVTCLISCTRHLQYCRYYSIPLCDQMNAVLKHNGFSWSRCFQIENTGSKLEESVGIIQIAESSVVNWAIITYTFLIFARFFGHGTKK